MLDFFFVAGATSHNSGAVRNKTVFQKPAIGRRNPRLQKGLHFKSWTDGYVPIPGLFWGLCKESILWAS